MIDFLIKSSIALCSLLAVYYIFLEKEKMHQFNRFYLLFSLIFSLALPFYTIEIIRKTIAIPDTEIQIIDLPQTTTIEQSGNNYLSVFLLIIYCLITVVLFFKFIRNILDLNTQKRKNKKIKHKNTTIVLLDKITLPYTFLNTIFMNKHDYESKKIEPELFTHELIHVKQKHTLDILFIELLKTIFWFNPIFIFYKKAIQLNHEFLADEKVVTSYNNVSYYQNLLITKANTNPTYYLASNLNYSVTKKRLIMMTKTSSKRDIWAKKILLAPLLSALVFLLCTKTVAQVTTEKQPATKKLNSFKTYYDKTTFKIKDEKGNITTEKKYNELTPIEKKSLPSMFGDSKEMPTNEEIMAMLEKGAPETIEVDIYDPKNIKVKKGKNYVYKVAEISENPSYPGGIENFYKFIGETFQIPETPKDVVLKGRVYITFVVEKDGSLSDYKILRDIGYGTGEETIRVLKLSPNWTPGKIDGEAVRTMYSLPITVQSE